MKNLIITFLFSISFCVSIFAQYGSEGSTDARSMSLGKLQMQFPREFIR